jgi:ABC-type transporter Mla subunit MlaD
VDIETIDQNYQQLQQQSQQTVQAISALAQKLQAAANAGDQNAREWLLDLKGITLGFQQEQNQVSLLLQAIHNYVANQTQQQPPVYQQQPPVYQQQPPQYQQPQYQYQQPVYQSGWGGGGGFGGFLNSGFGQAIATGAGFAIGEDIINDIF